MSTAWRPFQKGTTLGLRGSEDGVVIRDEEHEEGSRITLERDTPDTPFAITCGIYGWMVHTCTFGTEAEATSEYEQMKLELAEILNAIPYMDDPAEDERTGEVGKLLGEFVDRHSSWWSGDPAQEFKVQVIPKNAFGTVLALGASLSLMIILTILLNLAADRSTVGQEKLAWTIILSAGLAFGLSVLIVSFVGSLKSSGRLRLDPDAIRLYLPDTPLSKLTYADLLSAQCVNGALVLQGKKSSIELPVAGFEDPSAVETILKNISTIQSGPDNMIPAGGIP